MQPYFGIIRADKHSLSSQQDEAWIHDTYQRFPGSCAELPIQVSNELRLCGDFQYYNEEGNDGCACYFIGDIFNRSEYEGLFGNDLKDHVNDAALAARLIQRNGIDAVRNMNGQFLIVYCDFKTNQCSIVNDHIGIQQMIYYRHNNFILFGSEVKLIMGHPDCPKEIDWSIALKRPQPHVVLGAFKSYATWFRDLYLLPGASILGFDLTSGVSSLSNYWRLQDFLPAKNDVRNAQQVMEEYFLLLEDAVRIRMNPTGVTHGLLSGGLDSSAICALAARHGKLQTYSIINQTTVLEETTNYCHTLSQELGCGNAQYLIPYHKLVFNADLWKRRVWRAESPVNHTDSFTKTMLHHAIQRSDNKARYILSGTGSDQLNGGLAAYVVGVLESQEEGWRKLHAEILDVENKSLIAREEDSLWEVRHFVNRSFLSEAAGLTVEENSWLVCIDSALHAQAFSLLWDEQRAASAHGHVTCYPFLDYRIAEFIAAVPLHLHQELFLDKQILREPCKKLLPDYIVNKPKMPYNLPEYDIRAELYESLTQDGPDSLFTAAFGDIHLPHPVIDKHHLFKRIQAMREKPEIMEWLRIMHIINIGLLEQLAGKQESDMQYEADMGVPVEVNFKNMESAQLLLKRELDILTEDQLLDKPVQFGENCSLLIDTKTQGYFLSKRNHLLYELDDEAAEWKQFLMKIDQQKSARDIVDELDIAYEKIEEFFMLAIKEQILVLSLKSKGY